MTELEAPRDSAVAGRTLSQRHVRFRRMFAAALLVVGACSRQRPSLAPDSPVTGRVIIDANGRNFNLPPRPPYHDKRESGVEDGDLDALWVRRLMVPVDGFSREGLRDTYSSRRDGDRSHRAIDLLSRSGTPVIAADDQVIGRMSTTPLGGIIIYASDLGAQFVYYYAHLMGYRHGLVVGDTVARGEVIGYVGSTGNASPDEPHLHFQVMKRGAGRAWWDGPPINPYLFFAFDGRKK
jgi:murein DD-endopeptidase MepM/ murein hydrolase activator NlpD